jgi:glycosyltransferase involved in cell wall biosynthesis
LRILFLTAEFPFPPQSGATLKTHGVLDYLRARHDVRTLSFTRAPLSVEQLEWAERAGVSSVVQLARGRSPLNLLRSYLAGVPLSIQRNQSGQMASAVQESIAAFAPDAIFADGWLMAQYLPASFRGLKLLHEHNAEHLLWLRQAEYDPNPLRRLLLRREYQRVRRYEAGILADFDVVFAVSEPDRAALMGLAPGAGVRVLPNLPDESLLERPALSFEQSEPLVFYYATLSWPPNVEGLRYFLRQVWPAVYGRVPDARFVIAGRGAPPDIERLAKSTEGVDFAGPVSDAEKLYRRARASVEPTHSGGGTKLKVLNSLARGLPVVAGPNGAEGIDAVPGEHFLLGETPSQMAEAVVRLLSDAALWQMLSTNGRRLIAQRYVARVAYTPLDEVLSGAHAAR